jgi:putative oxidoreductase
MVNIRTRPDIALLVIRIAAGFSFFMHGWQKWQMGIGNVEAGFGQMGIPLPGLAAPFIAGLETIGGIAMILGGGTRVFAALLFCDMLTATMLVHAKNGWLGQGGMELTALLGAMALGVALAGAGAFSIDGAIGSRRTATP